MRRFATLDALRGIAAIGVVFSHSQGFTLRTPSGYLAVDLFFGLSGFVMAFSYQQRLLDGLGTVRFLALRAARLWPMLLVGAMLGIILRQGSMGMLLLIPDPSSTTGQLFPANGPLWSLLMEAGAYLAFALFIVRLGVRGLIALTVVCGIALLACALTYHDGIKQFGNDWKAVPQGCVRTVYAFSLGALMYRLREATGAPRITSTYAWLLPFALFLVMLNVPATNQIAALACMMCGVPLILWIATKWEIPHLRISERLSDLSYPLYCIHAPILGWALTAYGVPGPALWLPLVALSVGLDRWWDRPVRRVLRGWAEGSPAAVRLSPSAS